VIRRSSEILNKLENSTFRELYLLPSPSSHLKTETDPISKTLLFYVTQNFRRWRKSRLSDIMTVRILFPNYKACILNIQSPINFLLNHILNCYCGFQRFEICHIFTACLLSFCPDLPCILVMKQQDIGTLNSLCIYFYINSNAKIN
jgi:hypothetical protein